MASSFTYASSELDAMASAPNYYQAILSFFQPHLGRSVLEVGAGIGTFSALLAGAPGVEQLGLLEPAGNNYPLLRERFAHDPRVRAVHGYLEQHTADFSVDSVVTVNVLEHVPDDAAFLRAARSVLRPGGRLLIFVPALPAIYGSLDTVFEHHRRYTRRTLRAALEGAGFGVPVLRYVNLPGVLAWFVTGRVLRKKTLNPRDVATYDRLVIPWLMKLERHWSPPLGQSLLAVAQA
ncbi:class I SAM-dependent methyltransferase [Longimicrobium sp.]|uniref:class I SAM-dependent methyltransferase n=1 Tax=Longimicrobium sp. TaxID=2029185 RepID=UPI002E37A8BB|nr:class I SAM-dependent methyltransferase [Longimicrobium sp.]HEX6037532.1 class I SAM-dependent methyltransferase [Longimicrobium sp.]